LHTVSSSPIKILILAIIIGIFRITIIRIISSKIISISSIIMISSNNIISIFIVIINSNNNKIITDVIRLLAVAKTTISNNLMSSINIAVMRIDLNIRTIMKTINIMNYMLMTILVASATIHHRHYSLQTHYQILNIATTVAIVIIIITFAPSSSPQWAHSPR